MLGIQVRKSIISTHELFTLIKMVKCPRCKTEAHQTGKEWKYHVFNVKSYYCKQCKKEFNAYYRDDELKYTIPKSS